MLAFHSDWEPAQSIAEAGGQGRRCELVMLGDYIDRGPSSLGVLRRLGALDRRLGVPVHRLLGNHDQLLLECLLLQPDPGALPLWLANGGETVLAKCGIGGVDPDGADPAAIAAQLRARIGPELVGLLKALKRAWRSAGYLFVHAGVQPARPLEMQQASELIWIREPFLSGVGWSHDFAVVHGHTPLGPDVHSHRIGVDSGCIRTGALTAVELADDRLRFRVVADLADAEQLAAALPADQPRRFARLP